jgi:hypothetical protein
MRKSHGRLPAIAVGLVAPRGYTGAMKAKRPPIHLRHPLSGKTYRIPYVRTFAFLAFMAILLVLAALGRAAPPQVNLDGIDPTPLATEFPSTASPVPGRAP